MQDIGLREVHVKSLQLPDDFIERCESLRVRSLAESIHRHGLLHYPVVRATDLQLITGGDRVAAEHMRGNCIIKVRMVNCDDRELEEIRLVENVRRRHDPKAQDEALAKLLESYKERARKARHKHPTKKKPPSINKLARQQVAKDLGITEEAVRMRERRRRKREEKEQQEQEAELKETFETQQYTFGLKLDPKLLSSADVAAGACQEVKGRIATCQSLLGKLEGGFPPGVRDTLQQMLQDMKSILERNVPVSVCPWCKCIPLVRQNCTQCSSTGFVGRGQIESVPSELKSLSPLCVAYNNRYMDFMDAAEASNQYFRDSKKDPWERNG